MVLDSRFFSCFTLGCTFLVWMLGMTGTTWSWWDLQDLGPTIKHLETSEHVFWHFGGCKCWPCETDHGPLQSGWVLWFCWGSLGPWMYSCHRIHDCVQKFLWSSPNSGGSLVLKYRWSTVTPTKNECVITIRNHGSIIITSLPLLVYNRFIPTHCLGSLWSSDTRACYREHQKFGRSSSTICSAVCGNPCCFESC